MSLTAWVPGARPEAALGTLDGHRLFSPHHLPAWLLLHSYSFREEAGARGKGLAHLTSVLDPCLLLGAMVMNVLMSYCVPLSLRLVLSTASSSPVLGTSWWLAWDRSTGV